MKTHTAPAALRLSTAAAVLVLASLAGHAASAHGPATPASAMPSAPPSLAQDIRDIRGPKPVQSAWFMPLIGMSVLLTGAGVYATWAWYRRRKRPLLRTSFEIALDRLEAARALMRPDLGRDFSIEVSSIARGYIESRFHVMAAHLTTHEFLHDSLASHDPVLAAHRALLADFLASCDLAKFGGWNPSLPTMEALWQSARRFIVESAIEPNPSDIAGAASAASPLIAEKQSLAPRETYDSIPST